VIETQGVLKSHLIHQGVTNTCRINTLWMDIVLHLCRAPLSWDKAVVQACRVVTGTDEVTEEEEATVHLRIAIRVIPRPKTIAAPTVTITMMHTATVIMRITTGRILTEYPKAVSTMMTEEMQHQQARVRGKTNSLENRSCILEVRLVW